MISPRSAWYNTITMKIKKPMTMKAPGGNAAAPGGAAIADRFRLDVQPQAHKGATVNAKAVAWAFSAGCVALALLGVLVYMMYQHAEYLHGV